MPIHNRASCVTCVTNLASTTNHPQWKAVCANSGKHLFVAESRVSIEVWDNHGKGKDKKVFLGGVSLTIPQLLSHGDSHKELHLALTGGTASGQVDTRITWTPRG